MIRCLNALRVFRKLQECATSMHFQPNRQLIFKTPPFDSFLCGPTHSPFSDSPPTTVAHCLPLHSHAVLRGPHSPSRSARFGGAFTFHFVFGFLTVIFAFTVNLLGNVIVFIAIQPGQLVLFWK